MTTEIELGCTGGEEDGVDNSHMDASALYTQPEDVNYAYEKLNAISPRFTIAASFGNVHGVYKPGNVKLTPTILRDSQKFVCEKHGLPHNALDFVFHGGSGSSAAEIEESISYGVIKMNIDTDTQWATWDGILQYYKKNEGYLQAQLGTQKALISRTRNTTIHASGCALRRHPWWCVWSRRSKNSTPLTFCK